MITKLTANLSVSPQIRAADLPMLKQAGFRAIVNNRPDAEEAGQPRSEELREAAKRLGLSYLHIPVVPGKMTDGDAAAMAHALAVAKGPVLAFCRTGTRSTNLWKRSLELAGTPVEGGNS